MGAGSQQEPVTLEKMEGTNAREEKILVLVRLRPLSEKENLKHEVSDWECINDSTILYQNTLREGSSFPNVYTFDRVFRDDCCTRQVYEEGAKEIALSVVNGVNSIIFAYGQTCSGKTYTMNGITEYTIADIFDYIRKHEERAFVLKFSVIEIYNEVVRDLLSTDNTPLRLRDYPDRGIIVERATEETLRDGNHLKELLSICEAQRRIEETALNEKSSRSHQLIRLTIESSAREFLGKDNSTTLAASVNFVDLAGSERASEASSVGARLKEGCHINRSLLTLGTVIRKLSKGRQGHINYRDSKLTRILQPCLGGNARTAIICTLSPARSHVEQTRNTLLFACCAKEVTTRAQVNVVMSDKALIKHLQRELARLECELKTPVRIQSNSDHTALLRKKDLQIEKMEKEIRMLTKQRDLAQSRVEDLLQMVRNDSNQEWLVGDEWKDECSALESSSMADTHCLNVSARRFIKHHFPDGEGESNFKRKYSGFQHTKKTRDHSLTDGTSSLQSNGQKFVRSDSDDCEEVLCIETEEPIRDNSTESIALSTIENGVAMTLTEAVNDNITSQQIMLTPAIEFKEGGQNHNGLSNGALEDYPKESFPRDETGHVSTSGSHERNTSWSCEANLVTGSSSPERAETTPPCSFEKGFSGRPEGFGKKITPLTFGLSFSRFDFKSSLGDGQREKSAANEDITSLNTSVAGLNDMTKLDFKERLNDMTKLDFKEQLVVDGRRVEVELESGKLLKNGKVYGIDLIRTELETRPDWPDEYEQQQRMICDLWQTCNVSLVHRTYFFLLVNGDQDSIYLEMEIRRLTSLKENFLHGNQILEDGRGQTKTLAASSKDLCREREMLNKLMKKRFSEEERKRLFQKWGIALKSKRRRLQLANCLWSNSKDMNHITENAAIVAKLVRFGEHGQALMGMFGLSFPPPCIKRRAWHLFCDLL